jgi:cytochrome c-type biogenesis protein CcmH/NrfF
MQRHRFDPLSFAFGIVIAAIGFWLLAGNVDVTDLRLTWVWPVPLIVLGLLMLVSARRREDRPEESPAEADASDRAHTQSVEDVESEPAVETKTTGA